jgi:hypothetical protein
MRAVMESGQRRSLSVAVLAVVTVLGSACTGGGEQPSGAPGNGPTAMAPSDPTSSARQVAVGASLAGVDTGTLPRLSPSIRLPNTIPPVDAAVPSLLDDLPGRAVVVINPEITTLNSPGEGWSGLTLLFFGVDGRWRRLAMEDLGLPDSAIYGDTYSSGALSTDGRWWVGPTDRGMVAWISAPARRTWCQRRSPTGHRRG